MAMPGRGHCSWLGQWFPIIDCIGEGINTKMKLAVEVGARAGISRQSAIRIIEKYTGTDPTRHKWQFTVGNRGAQIYAILAPATPE